MIRSRYNTKTPTVQSSEEELPDTTDSPQSVSTIDSNLLQNNIQSTTPVYKTIDRNTFIKTTTLQSITDQTNIPPVTTSPTLLPSSEESDIDNDLLTENIIYDSTEIVTVTVDPLLENEIVTENIRPIYNRLFIQSASENDVAKNLNNLLSSDRILTQNNVFEKTNSNSESNTLKESTVYAPRPFSPRRSQISSTTESRGANDLSESGKVSSIDSRTQTRAPIRYSTLPSRRFSQLSTEEEMTTPRPLGIDKGRGRIRFRAKPTKSGLYNKNLDPLSQPTIKEPSFNENRLRAINFDRSKVINSNLDQPSDQKADTKITKLRINKTLSEPEARPDRLQFELTLGRKLEFGFTSKRPQSTQQPQSDSPIVRVITGPLSKSPISPKSPDKRKGAVEELQLLKTKTTTINLAEPSYSNKEDKIDSTLATTEYPNRDETTANIFNEEENETTFSPNDDIVQSEGNTGFIPRKNNVIRKFVPKKVVESSSSTTELSKNIQDNVQPESEIGIQRKDSPYRRRPFISRTRTPPSIESVVKSEVEIDNLQASIGIRRRPATTAQTESSVVDEKPILDTTEKSVRARLRPSKSGYRTRQSQSQATLSDSQQQSSIQTFIKNSNEYSGNSEENSDEFVNIILKETNDLTTDSPNDQVTETYADEETTYPNKEFSTSTLAPGTRRRIVQVIRKPSPKAVEELTPYERNKLFITRTKNLQRQFSNKEENDDSTVPETTEENSFSSPQEQSTRSPVSRKRVQVFRKRTKTPEDSTEEKESPSSTPSSVVRKTKIIRRPTKAPIVEENIGTSSESVSPVKSYKTRIIRKKKPKAEVEKVGNEEIVNENSSVLENEQQAEINRQRKVVRVFRKNSTKTENSETTEAELSTTSRATRPSRLSYVRRINVRLNETNNENDIPVSFRPPSRRTLIRRPISTTTQTISTTELSTFEPEDSIEEDDRKEIEESLDQKKISDINAHNEPDISDEEESDENSNEDEENERVNEQISREVSEEKIEKPSSSPILRYPTRPSFGQRPLKVVTIQRRPFGGSTRQTTIHPASTRFAATQGFGFTKTRRVTTKKYPKLPGNFKFTKQSTTAAPQNTFTPLQDTEDLLTTTIDYKDEYDHTELINNDNILQEIEGKKKQSSKLTTTVKPTTLHHIFAIDSDEESKLNKLEGQSNVTESAANEIIKKLEKLVEINRIVEIHSREDKLKFSKNRKVKKIDSGDVKLLQAPMFDKYGEISRLKIIKLAKIPESTTTENKLLNQKTSIFSEAVFVETSTIPLEGLFEKKSSDSLENEDSTSTFVPYTTIYDNDSSMEDTTENIPRTKTKLTLEKINSNDKNISLLRPESSENDPLKPLVISLSNLDQVILSKVKNSESTTQRPSPVFKPDGDAAGSSNVDVVINKESARVSHPESDE